MYINTFKVNKKPSKQSCSFNKRKKAREKLPNILLATPKRLLVLLNLVKSIILFTIKN